MSTHIRSIAVIAAALVLLALPVRAQDGGGSVAFNGVGFSFSADLGSSVAVIQVTGTLPDSPEDLDAPHLSFSLSNVRVERPTVPGPWRSDGVVSAYRTEDLEGADLAGEQYDQLQTLLAERPDLDTYMVVVDLDVDDYLPYLPVAGGGQLLRARAEYIDTPEVSGVAYVTAFSQDLTRLAASDFWYTFQGISADGSWYVALSWVLTVDGFPARVGGGLPRDYPAYLNRTIATINEAGAETFSPSLTSLDALARSFTFEAPSAGEPSPGPSPSASPAG
jgi:hypothetical protein